MSLRQSLLCLTLISLSSTAIANTFSHSARQALADALEAYKYQDISSKRAKKMQKDEKRWLKIYANRIQWENQKKEQEKEMKKIEALRLAKLKIEQANKEYYEIYNTLNGNKPKRRSIFDDMIDEAILEQSVSGYIEPIQNGNHRSNVDLKTEIHLSKLYDVNSKDRY